MTGHRPPRLPQPTYAPALMALGLMALLWGAVTTWLMAAAGLILVGFASFRWMEALRRHPQGEPVAAGREPEPQERAAPLAAAVDDPIAYRSALHWYTVALAVCTLGLLVSGGLVTSHEPAPSALLLELHLIAGSAVGVLSLGFALWSARGPKVRRLLGWIVVGGAALLAVLGRTDGVAAVFHAWLAQLFFTLTVVGAVVTAQGWIHPKTVEGPARLRLRPLSAVAVVLMVLQVGMGAAVRHKVMGAVPHIVGALIVTIVLLLTAILVTNQLPEHAALHPVAKTLIGLTFTQVMLGMGTFITRLMMEEGSLAVVIPSVAHVVTGSLTLAATVILALIIRRCVPEIS